MPNGQHISLQSGQVLSFPPAGHPSRFSPATSEASKLLLLLPFDLSFPPVASWRPSDQGSGSSPTITLTLTCERPLGFLAQAVGTVSSRWSLASTPIYATRPECWNGGPPLGGAVGPPSPRTAPGASETRRPLPCHGSPRSDPARPKMGAQHYTEAA